MLLAVLTLLLAVPELIAALSSLLTGPRIGHNRPKMNLFHPLAPVVNRIRQALPLRQTPRRVPPANRFNPTPERQLNPGGLDAIRAY
jgi:hypothetical protein